MQAAEERAALAENAIREEVSAEMGDLLREMEATYKVSSHLPSVTVMRQHVHHTGAQGLKSDDLAAHGLQSMQRRCTEREGRSVGRSAHALDQMMRSSVT